MAEGIAQLVEFCREQVALASSAEAFETWLRDAMNGMGCKLLGSYAQSQDNGANHIERDRQSWFPVSRGGEAAVRAPHHEAGWRHPLRRFLRRVEACEEAWRRPAR